MALSLGTVTLSTQDAVDCSSSSWCCGCSGVLSAEADPAPAPGWSIAAEQGTLCPLHPGPGPRSGLAAGARHCPPSAFCCSTETPLCSPRAGYSPVTLSPGGCA